jgi:glutamine---fructose-6-phosphate transaminase (isomerizing)
MCGIVGYVGRQDGVPVLLEGLQRLEYRGYDSAGLAVVKNDALRTHKAEGRVRDLAESLPKRVSGGTGIAHTRWATHGPPSDENAHPHVDAAGNVAVVHNGIIENATELRAALEADGVTFASDTDTEVLAHLIGRSQQPELADAVREALGRVRGAYGIAVVDARHPDRIVVARNGSPVVLGIGRREMLVASDVAALVRHVQQVVHLDDGEIAVLQADGYSTSTLDRRPVQKEPSALDGDVDAYEKGGFETYLRKEIAEQPEALRGTLRGRLQKRFSTAHLGGIEMTPRELGFVKRVKILGCGSAFYAGMVGAELIESLARLPADAEAASEFRYRNPVVDPDCLYVAVSQSGETADTLAAVQELKRKGGRVLGVVNVVGSSIARECGNGIYLHAGPRCPSPPRRRSRRWSWRSRCWRCTSAASATSRPPTGPGSSPGWSGCPSRSTRRSTRTWARSPSSWPSRPAPSTSAGCAATPSRWRGRRSSRRSPTSTRRPTPPAS